MTLGRLATLAIATALALAATGSARVTTAAETFRVRPDLRLCPSPLCGGYSVTRVNRSTTICGDGAVRPWCYVAGISLPVRAAKSGGEMLARGKIVHGDSGEIRPLDRLVASQAWLAATRVPASGTVLLVTDTGIRCVRAPCFSLRTSTVNTVRKGTASGLDLSLVRAPSLAGKAQLALRTGGLLVAATVRRDTDGGRTVVASQFFLAAD